MSSAVTCESLLRLTFSSVVSQHLWRSLRADDPPAQPQHNSQFTRANYNCPARSTSRQVSTKSRSLPIQVSMPSGHYRGTVIRTNLEDTACAPCQEPSLHPFFTRRTDRIKNIASNIFFPKSDGQNHPGHFCAALITRAQRDTRESILKRSQIFSVANVGKRSRSSPQQLLPLNYTSFLQSGPSKFRSLQIQVHINIKSIKDQKSSVFPSHLPTRIMGNHQILQSRIIIRFSRLVLTSYKSRSTRRITSFCSSRKILLTSPQELIRFPKNVREVCRDDLIALLGTSLDHMERPSSFPISPKPFF